MSTDPATIADEGADEPVALTEVETLASEMGWRPEKDYEGPEGKWKDASSWLKAERTINRGLKETVKGLKDTVDRLGKTATKQTERLLKEQAEEIEARFATAVENKDVKGAAKAAKDMDELRIEAAPTVTPKDTEDQFARDNPWYGVDRKATAFAIMVANELGAKKVPLQEQLEQIQAEVKKEFPDLFSGEANGRKAPPLVAAPSRSAPVSRAKGVADLPPAAKAAMEDFVKLAVTKHKKDPEAIRKAYASDYWENVAS